MKHNTLNFTCNSTYTKPPIPPQLNDSPKQEKIIGMVLSEIKKNNLKEALKIIDDSNIDINLFKDYKGNTILHLLAEKGGVQAIKYLIENFKTILINFMNDNGESPLDIAIYEGHTELINYLKEYGAQSCQEDKASSDKSPFEEEVFQFDEEVTSLEATNGPQIIGNVEDLNNQDI